jgi:hypothetical protein
MIPHAPDDKTPRIVLIIIIILPFFLFYWMMPFVSNVTLGKDYQEFSIQNQMELLFSIRTGSFPLYVPGYALGQSSSALTLGQVFHPLSHIASFLPGYWDGKALEWNTFLRLLSLGLTQLALFAFLRSMRLTTLFAFLASCITVYNMRMLDLFRFGASLETYTGFLLLCTAIGWYFVNPTKWIGPFSIIGATYWLVCSGHPTMMYYGILGSVLFLFVMPFFAADMFPERRTNFRIVFWFWAKVGIFLMIGLLLSAAYVVPFYFDFISENSLRVAQNYDFSLSYETFFGTLSNFFMPFFSEVHGAFGGSYLFLMAAVMPVLRLFKIKIPRSIWIIWVILLLAFLYMQGARTPVHRWAWEYLPFASSIRGEGRISLIIPLFVMLLLSWIFTLKSVALRFRSTSITVSPYALLASISLLLIPVYIALSVVIKPEIGIFSPVHNRVIPLWVMIMVCLSGMASLAMLIFYSFLKRRSKATVILICSFLFAQLGGILQYGSFVAPRNDQPSFEQMKAQKRVKLDYRYSPGSGMYSSVVLRQLEQSFLEPFLGKLFTEVIPVSSQGKAYKLMQQRRIPQQAFVEGFDPVRAAIINEGAHGMQKGTVTLIYSSYNQLKFRVYSERNSLFGLSYPNTGHWEASVNNKKVPVYRANGAAYAVEVPEGESLVEFSYWSSAAFWGMMISCVTFMVVGLSLCGMTLNGLPRFITAVLVLIIGAGGAALWTHSLYTGDNLNTAYTWHYSPVTRDINLAYGKKTSIFPIMRDSYLLPSTYYHTHKSRIVDGDRRVSSGYSVNLVNGPSVTIDLFKTENINSIVLYKSIPETPVTIRHLELSISEDGITWNTVASFMGEETNDHPVRIKLESLSAVRYVKVKASGTGWLNLDELEIYGK